MKIKWRVRSSSKAINNCWEWGEGKEFYNHHRPPGFVLPQMDRWSWCEEGLNHNCHLTSSSIQTSRRTSFCPIKPDPGLSSTYNWVHRSSKHRIQKYFMAAAAYVLLPQRIFFSLCWKMTKNVAWVFFRASLRMKQKRYCQPCGFSTFNWGPLFSFDLFPPLNYRVGSDTSDRHPRLNFYS